MRRASSRRSASAQLQQLFGHHPAVGDPRSALLHVDGGEQGSHLRLDLVRLEALVVEEAALAVVLDDEGLLVVAAVDAESLRQAPAPGPLLTDGAVARPGNEFVDLFE